MSASLSSAGRDLYWGPVCSCTLLFQSPHSFQLWLAVIFTFLRPLNKMVLVPTISSCKSLIEKNLMRILVYSIFHLLASYKQFHK